MRSLKKLRETVAHFDLEVKWRRPENEKEAAQLNSTDRLAYGTSTPFSEIILSDSKRNSAIVDRWVRKRWGERWERLEGHRQTRIWYKGPDREKARLLLSKTRADLGINIQFITGHGWLRRHRHVVGEIDDPTCRLCGDGPEELGHLFFHCEALSWDRSRAAEGVTEWTVEDLEGFLQIPEVKELLGQGDAENQTGVE